MDFLKYNLLIILLVLTVVQAEAQQKQQRLEEAFALSYEKELEGDFMASSVALKKVYDVDSYEINIRLGWLTYNAGFYNDAVKYYGIAHRLRPYSEEARFGLIYPKSALGKWDEVIDLYKEILEIHPHSTTAMYRLGLIFYERKDYSRAYQLFKKVVDLYPFEYDGLIMLAWTSYCQGNYNQARVLFNKVKLIKPEDKSAAEGLALLD